jgi:beta-lactamase class A
MASTDDRTNRIGQSLTRRTALIGGAAGLALAGLAGTHAGAIAKLQATPEPDAGSAPTWEEIDANLATSAPNAVLLAAELIDGAPVELHAVDADRVMPIGSSFKFYVLGALSMEIEAGNLDWEQMVAIVDEHKSVPGGDLRYVPNGTEFTLRYLAERMMQKSDNTATDALIYLVGREKVEEAMGIMGHHDPSLNIPLFTTREFAFMKLVVPAEQLDAYFASTVEERRQFLTDVVAKLSYEDLIAAADAQTGPINLFGLEWFATRYDLANAVAYLWAQSQKEGLRPVAEVIALETQLTFDGEVWPYVGFKGGSELGMLSGTWLLQRADGRMFVYSLGFADETAELNMGAIIPVMEQGRDRLALTE